MTTKSTRKIKLQPKSRVSQESFTGFKSVPWLNVSGVWLEHAGFKAGDTVTIIVEPNQLIIKSGL